MWQLEEQQYHNKFRQRYERHQYFIGWKRDTGHLGDIVHERLLGDELAEVAGRVGEG